MLDLTEQLSTCCRGRVCLLGIGNTDLGDDGFGALLAEELFGACQPPHQVLVAGSIPERWIGKVRDDHWDVVLLLDAVDFGARAGSVVLLSADEIVARFPQISTHKISLGLLAQCIQSNGKTQVWLLGVQPASLVSGAGLSPVLRESLRLVADILRGAFASGQPTPVLA